MTENGYTLGLVSISFRQHTPEEILEAVKNAGLSCVEWGSDIHAPCRNLARLHEIAALQKESGIACSSYGTYFRLGETPVEELEDYINAAKILDTGILRLWCGSKCGAEMTAREREDLLAVCRRAAAIAALHGVKLCMECHKNTFTENPDDVRWLMEQVNSPAFRMYWQPFQWQDAQTNIENARAVAPYAEHIHVFHWKEDRKLPLSDAIEEWRMYLREFSAPRTLLLEFMPDDQIGSLPAETRGLKTIIGETL